MPMRTHEHTNGTHITSNDWGFVSARVLCSDGRIRTVKRIAISADTFFSVPAAVSVKGRTVTGFVGSGEDGVTFTAYTYRKNGYLLP